MKKALLFVLGIFAVGGLHAGAFVPYIPSTSTHLIDIKLSGAKGDGVTDDSAVFQAAFNASTQTGGCLIYVPASTSPYIIGTRLVIYSSTTLLGAGEGSVILKAKSTLNTKMMVNQAWGGIGTDTGINIKNIVFDEAGSSHGSSDDTSLTLARINNSSIENCKFINGTSGLFLLTGATFDDNHHFYFINDVFDSSNLIAGGTDISDIGNGNDIQMIRCVFVGGYPGSGNPQISAAFMDNFLIDGCIFDGQQNGDPMNLLGVTNSQIKNSEFKNSNGAGTVISHAHEGVSQRFILSVTIDGCHYHHNLGQGIYLRQNVTSTDTIRNVSIINSEIDNNSQDGVRDEVSSHLIISHNYIHNNNLVAATTCYALNFNQVSNTQNSIFDTIIDYNIFYDTQTSPTQTKAINASYVNVLKTYGNRFSQIITTYTVANAANYDFYDGVKQNSVGSFTRDMTSASGNVSYTGLGFMPTKCFFTSLDVTIATNTVSWGYDDGLFPSAVSQIADRSIDSWSATQSVGVEFVANTYQMGHVFSFDADGFTIAWTKTGSPSGTMRAFYNCDH